MGRSRLIVFIGAFRCERRVFRGSLGGQFRGSRRGVEFGCLVGLGKTLVGYRGVVMACASEAYM